MGLSEEEAYDILGIPHNSSYQAVLKSYKRLSLYWFPDKHNFSPTALEKFQKISLAVMKLSFPDKDICFSLTVTDMLMLFQQIFFGGENGGSDDEVTPNEKNENLVESSDKRKNKGDVVVSIPKNRASDVTSSKSKNEAPKSVPEAQNATSDEVVSLIKKQRKKAEKRKAEKKRKKERKKMEKASEQSSESQDVKAIQDSILKKRAETGICEGGDNKEGLFNKFQESCCDSNSDYNDVDNYSGTLSDEYYVDDSDYLDTDDDYDDPYVGCESVMPDPLAFLFAKLNAVVSMQANSNAEALIDEEARKKKKIEQRKAQKKKRKEKKKQEKAALEHMPGAQRIESPVVETVQRNEEEQSQDSAEDIDLSSAFVTVIAKKTKKLLKLPQDNLSEVKKITAEAILGAGKNFAKCANEMLISGSYLEALPWFTRAIKMDSTNSKYYGLRSYCYEKLGQHRRALKDAETSIHLMPKWSNAHFVKGKALIGLKKYAEAERSYREVVVLNPEHHEAQAEMLNARVLQLVEKGFSKKQAQAAVQKTESVSSALSLLLSEDLSKGDLSESDVFVSDSDSDNEWFFPKSNSGPKTVQKTELSSASPHASLWIGNVQPQVTTELLTSMFSRFGEIKNVNLMSDKFCAFINYYSGTAAKKAMDTFQGYQLYGVNLLIRYPKKAEETAQEECFFWRTTGCAYPVSCRFKHVKEHKGIDKKG